MLPPFCMGRWLNALTPQVAKDSLATKGGYPGNHDEGCNCIVAMNVHKGDEKENMIGACEGKQEQE